jgi:hypothetical protein
MTHYERQVLNHINKELEVPILYINLPHTYVTEIVRVELGGFNNKISSFTRNCEDVFLYKTKKELAKEFIPIIKDMYTTAKLKMLMKTINTDS